VRHECRYRAARCARSAQASLCGVVGDWLDEQLRRLLPTRANTRQFPTLRKVKRDSTVDLFQSKSRKAVADCFRRATAPECINNGIERNPSSGYKITPVSRFDVRLIHVERLYRSVSFNKDCLDGHTGFSSSMTMMMRRKEASRDKIPTGDRK
jgi:hypothetical protein